MLNKERKKYLRKIYEDKIGKEYVEELKKQPFISPMEFVDMYDRKRQIYSNWLQVNNTY